MFATRTTALSKLSGVKAAVVVVARGSNQAPKLGANLPTVRAFAGGSNGSGFHDGSSTSSTLPSWAVLAGGATVVTGVFTSRRTAASVPNKVVQQSSLLLQKRTMASPAIRSATNSTKSSATQAASTAGSGSTSTAAASKSTAAYAPPQRQSMLEWYEGHLQRRPVVTKMITGSFLWGLGDVVAQVVPVVMSPSPALHSLDSFDAARTGRAVFFGFAIHAPTSHVHFNLLETMTVRAGLKGLQIPIFKAFMEQFVYWSWISNSMYHGAMALMQGLTVEESVQRINDLLWETQKAQWAFWIPIQLLNFRFVPVRHQLNVVLLTSVVWTALLSAWYPPEQPQALLTDSESNEEAKSTKKNNTK